MARPDLQGRFEQRARGFGLNGKRQTVVETNAGIVKRQQATVMLFPDGVGDLGMVRQTAAEKP
jgi:hypothetical protein